MTKIINAKKAIEISKKIKRNGKKIVLAGGCFDVLHIGHIRFLRQAKRQGDYLFILLESDENTKRLKGPQRPINSQTDRAEILASLIYVDFVVLLKKMKSNSDYDNLIYNLNPNIIAITKNGKQKIHAQRQAEKLNAKVVPVITRVEDKSTSNLAKIILERFEQ